MTDNEIMSSLHLCGQNGTSNKFCIGCPYNIYEDCGARQSKDAFELINSQKAEIERLQEENLALSNGQLVQAELCRHTVKQIAIKERAKRCLQPCEDTCRAYMCEKTIKSEAVREFAESLKTSIEKSVDDAWHGDGNGIYDAENVLVDIDNLVKEMVGD